MKKLICLLSAFLLLVGFSGCGTTTEASDADGTMEYTNTRNHDPAKQTELNTPSASLTQTS